MDDATGSILNGAFQRAGIIDELSLVVASIIAEAKDKCLFMDSIFDNYALSQVKNRNSIIYMNYKKTAPMIP